MAGLASGTIVDDRYRIVSRLGAGGMADVFLAEDEQLGRKVALKLLYQRFAEDPGFVERFRREAQAAAGLQHPNVVSVYDRGSFDGTYYIAMEYLPGRSLKQLIRDEAPLDPIRAIDITIQILRAARFAHRRGVIHRDLKPHNVIVDEADNAKVTDFGIARAGASDMTETGSIMGTAQYLSPEQAQGHAVSAGSDLYSIAVVLYEMLTGRVPFDAESAVTIALKHVSEAPPPPTAINPSVPSELEQVVMWGLNKNPVDRPANADQFITALEQAKAAIQSGERGERTASLPALAGVAAGRYAAAAALTAPRAPAPPARGDTLGGVVVGPFPEDQYPPEHRRRWPWVLLVLALLCLVGGGVAAYLLTRSSATKVAVPSVTGEPFTVAQAQLQNAGFNVGQVQVTSQRKTGTVIGQDPKADAMVKQGTTVTLEVSTGPGNTQVPQVLGETLSQAKSAIEIANLKVGHVIEQPSTTIASGRVIQTSPAAGENPAVNTAVTLFVSTGPPPVRVPDVTGEAFSQAKPQLEGPPGNFTVTETQEVSTTVAPGSVISQSPVGGTSVKPLSTINLVVAKAPPTIAVPNVVGAKRGKAEHTLGVAGFPAVVQPQDVTTKSQGGVVLSQTPAAGAMEKKNTPVTIVVGHYVAPTPTTTTTTGGPGTTSTTSTTPTSGATTTPTP
jgi:serine/threonine-protein kinase